MPRIHLAQSTCKLQLTSQLTPAVSVQMYLTIIICEATPQAEGKPVDRMGLEQIGEPYKEILAIRFISALSTGEALSCILMLTSTTIESCSGGYTCIKS